MKFQSILFGMLFLLYLPANAQVNSGNYALAKDTAKRVSRYTQ